MMRINAPNLPQTLEWFNTAEPLNLERLQGKVVLLDFWTYCCINCLHVLADIRYLEEKYAETLVVIGLHSPKFPNERVAEHVQKAINRYDIRHPVANDPEFRVWKEYGVRAWPTLVLVDTEGYVVSALSGEGRRARLEELIEQLIAEGARNGTLKRGIIPIRLKPERDSSLKFPGKIHVFGDKLAISDSGHHRILIADQDGRVEAEYGSGVPRLNDGQGVQARFYDPQGLVVSQGVLYIADTGNHLIRAVELKSGGVRTIAGTGTQGRYPGNYFEDPLKAALNSPWDLAVYNGQLLIAMAGPHQIWAMNLQLNTIGVYAGSGREAILDGAAHEAAFAQPSGLSLASDNLYIADSETSAIRRINLLTQQVETLVGRGLFEFGDIDAIGSAARLQHALGVAADEVRGCVWIADTYNNKIKKLDIISNLVSSYKIDCALMEPSGITVKNNRMWITNTNLHQIIEVDLNSHQSHEFTLAT